MSEKVVSVVGLCRVMFGGINTWWFGLVIGVVWLSYTCLTPQPAALAACLSAISTPAQVYTPA